MNKFCSWIYRISDIKEETQENFINFRPSSSIHKALEKENDEGKWWWLKEAFTTFFFQCSFSPIEERKLKIHTAYIIQENRQLFYCFLLLLKAFCKCLFMFFNSKKEPDVKLIWNIDMQHQLHFPVCFSSISDVRSTTEWCIRNGLIILMTGLISTFLCECRVAWQVLTPLCSYFSIPIFLLLLRCSILMKKVARDEELWREDEYTQQFLSICFSWKTTKHHK